jgi:VWFA-related protein
MAACLAAALCAQEPVFRGGIDLVDVLASVRDKKGAFVDNLEQKDFRLYEDGVEQEIRRFSRQNDVPLTIGMVVDVSGSVAEEIPEERRAGLQFFRQVLRPDDRAFVIGFAREVRLLQDSTDSLRRLEQGLYDLNEMVFAPPVPRRFQSNQFPGGGRRGGGFPGGPGGQTGMNGGTVLHDAVYLAADDVLRELPGRKVIILITDGVDTGSQVTQGDALEALLRSDTIVYSILVEPPAGPGGGFGMGGGADKGTLDKYSDRTGGRVFKLERGDLGKVFDEIAEELRSQYAISYAPKKGVTGGNFRKIQVKVSKKDLKVRTRDGYYPKR